MTFHANLEDAKANHPWKTPATSHCFCCGKQLDGPLVGYDVDSPSEGGPQRVLMHRDCAFAMAQRIICDAWPKRRVGAQMQNNC